MIDVVSIMSAGFFNGSSTHMGLAATYARRRLTKLGLSNEVVVADLPTAAPLEVQASVLAARIGEVVRRTQPRLLVLVPHSTGGLVTRLVLEHHPEVWRGSTKVVVFYLGVPLRGTPIARLVPSRLGRQLRRDEGPRRPIEGVEEHIVAARFDFVVPRGSATGLAAPASVELINADHASLVWLSFRGVWRIIEKRAL